MRRYGLAISVGARSGTGRDPVPASGSGGICYVADGWAGCVEERGRGVHELSDGTPAMMPFTPYYWPSWGGVGNPGAEPLYNSYLPVPG